MRALLPLLCLVAGCSGSGEQANKTAPAPAPPPTGPAPETPVTNITPAPGKTPTWLDPRSNAGDPKHAPYGDVLDRPVVEGRSR